MFADKDVISDIDIEISIQVEKQAKHKENINEFIPDMPEKFLFVLTEKVCI